MLRSDLGIAAVFADATTRASRWNIAVNAPALAASECKSVLEQCEGLVALSAELCARVEAGCREGSVT
jgi:formiminotetrahydrofolate cyclodeaminase